MLYNLHVHLQKQLSRVLVVEPYVMKLKVDYAMICGCFLLDKEMDFPQKQAAECHFLPNVYFFFFYKSGCKLIFLP